MTRAPTPLPTKFGERAAGAHEPVDTDQQGQRGDRHGRGSPPGRGERDEARAGHAAGAFRGQHGDAQQGRLLAEAERGMSSPAPGTGSHVM